MDDISTELAFELLLSGYQKYFRKNKKCVFLMFYLNIESIEFIY